VIAKSESVMPHDVLACDVCVVGGGAAGITAALELENAGLQVILLEAGGTKWDPRCQDLYKGNILDPSTHAPLDEYRHRRLGGTTTVWGGRCIPFDSIDFAERDYVPHSGWPICLQDLEPYYKRAQQYCDCGDYAYNVSEALPGAPPNMIPGFHDGSVVTSRLERFSLPTDFGKTFYNHLHHTTGIRVLLNANCVLINVGPDGTRASTVEVCSLHKKQFRVKAKAFVLAAGGLEITRLLLVSDKVHKNGIGNHSGWLGRCYMSHISGNISEVKIDGDPNEVIFGYEKDSQGVYCRRRFYISEQAQREFRVLNFAAMLDNPPMHDPSHRNGVFSLVFFAKNIRAVRTKIPPESSKFLTMAGTVQNVNWAHLRNVVGGIPEIASFMPGFCYRRFAERRKIPSLVMKSRLNKYSVHYHAEQAPDPQSRVYLGDERDVFGMRRLEVDYRISDLDIQSIYRAHILIDRQLRKQGCGYLTFSQKNENRVVEDIRRQLGVGGHHIGTTRMSREPSTGVVDSECRIHGVSNLFVASSSVFPTSSQANPTLTIVAFAARIANHIGRTLQAPEVRSNSIPVAVKR
jgi:choline dehydrogenase-like flavoprotein